MTTVNDELLDKAIGQQIRWLRTGNTTAKTLLSFLNGADKRLSDLIKKGGTDFSLANRHAILNEVKAILADVHKVIDTTLKGDVLKVAETAAQLEADTINKAIPSEARVNVSVTTPNLGVLRTLTEEMPMNGLKLDDWLQQFKTNDLNRTWRAIQEQMIAGETTDAIIDNLIGTRRLRYKDGVRQASRFGVMTLARTAINYASNVGRQSTWDENDDIIKGVRWVSTLDTRTTPICRDRDGEVYPVDSGPRPPAHPNCRSTTVAVTKSFKEMGIDLEDIEPGTRASMNGQVPSKLTYYEWLAKQAASVQKEVLGPSRYKLWKTGKITPDKFVNDYGKTLTLEELKAYYPGAFKKTPDVKPPAAPVVPDVKPKATPTPPVEILKPIPNPTMPVPPTVEILKPVTKTPQTPVQKAIDDDWAKKQEDEFYAKLEAKAYEKDLEADLNNALDGVETFSMGKKVDDIISVEAPGGTNFFALKVESSNITSYWKSKFKEQQDILGETNLEEVLLKVPLETGQFTGELAGYYEEAIFYAKKIKEAIDKGNTHLASEYRVKGLKQAIKDIEATVEKAIQAENAAGLKMTKFPGFVPDSTKFVLKQYPNELAGLDDILEDIPKGLSIAEQKTLLNPLNDLKFELDGSTKPSAEWIAAKLSEIDKVAKALKVQANTFKYPEIKQAMAGTYFDGIDIDDAIKAKVQGKLTGFDASPDVPSTPALESTILNALNDMKKHIAEGGVQAQAYKAFETSVDDAVAMAKRYTSVKIDKAFKLKPLSADLEDALTTIRETRIEGGVTEENFLQTFKVYVGNIDRGLKTPNMDKVVELASAEQWALTRYTSDTYRLLNASLRGGGRYYDGLGERQHRGYAAFKDILNSALDKLDSYPGMVYRGIDDTNGSILKKYEDAWLKGETVTEKAFTSTSTNPSKAFGGTIRMNIRSKNGKHVQISSVHEAESEVLFRAGTEFRVVSITKEGRESVITLEEV